MRVLVIGSEGFIGKHALKMLPDLGYSVIACDILDESEYEHYIKIDKNFPDFYKVIKDVSPDICINCSGAASVPLSLEKPKNDFDLNVYKIVEILDAIRSSDKKIKFIHLSSAAVYGNPKSLPIYESDMVAPISPYGFHKKSAEDICREYFKFFGIESISLRIFSAFGEGLKKQLFWDVFNRSKTSNELVLYGTGKETRDFIYVKDIIRIFDLLIKKGTFDGEVINVASGVEVSISHAVKEMLNKQGWEGNIVFDGQGRDGDPVNWVADITKLYTLGYEPKFSFNVALEELVRWLKEQK